MTQQSNNVLAMWQAMMQFAGQRRAAAGEGRVHDYVRQRGADRDAGDPRPAATTQGAAK